MGIDWGPVYISYTPTDDLLKAGLKGDPAAEKLLGHETARNFVSCKHASAIPTAFHAFRGQIKPLDAPRDEKNTERLQWDVRRGMSSILNHPWIPATGSDALTVRGYIYDVVTGKIEGVNYPGAMGSIGCAVLSGRQIGFGPAQHIQIA